jgi:reactive intermediate/imine deaminase
MRPLNGLAFASIVVATTALAAGPKIPVAGSRIYVDARSNATNKTDGPFSGSVMAGNTLYISGQIGLGPDRKPPADVTEEAKLVLEAVKSQLVRQGLTMDDLVSVQVFCSDVKHFDAFNAVYRTYFMKEFPARAFLGSGTLLFGARFEVMGVAVKR